MRKIIINAIWLIIIVAGSFLYSYIIELYPEIKSMTIIPINICWLIILYHLFAKSTHKKVVYLFHLIWLLISFTFLYTYIARYYPHYIPSFITSYQVNNMMKKNKEYIDEILVLHKNAGAGNFDAFTYCLQVLIQYERWFEDNKFFIDQHPTLKESLGKELEKVINPWQHITYDEDNLVSHIVEYFKAILQKLRE